MNDFFPQILPLLLVLGAYYWWYSSSKKRRILEAEKLNNRFAAIEERLEKLEN